MNPGFVLAITGGSGAVYSLRLLEVLLAAGHQVHLSISPAGQAVLATELGLNVPLEADRFDVQALLAGCQWIYQHGGATSPTSFVRHAAGETTSVVQWSQRLIYHHYQNLLAPIASGSFLTQGMVIAPCSGATVSAIAHGSSGNLIQRAADVHLKERRRLILVPRETPLSAIQLENMARCATAGSVVLPAMPGWYHGVSRLVDLVDFIVARVCDQLGVTHQLVRRWGEPS